ncbi:hypothetical protein KIL84_023215 [Mauremys mutica]|uniref:Uncharacterized protein n=1 Tax=Mauremys mutica TaxID=74926 RepID=A0A9D3WRK0_9SAUR|nr:hypothetical protein KIL84_023215 [Mauremys mutica]
MSPGWKVTGALGEQHPLSNEGHVSSSGPWPRRDNGAARLPGTGSFPAQCGRSHFWLCSWSPKTDSLAQEPANTLPPPASLQGGGILTPIHSPSRTLSRRTGQRLGQSRAMPRATQHPAGISRQADALPRRRHRLGAREPGWGVGRALGSDATSPCLESVPRSSTGRA